MCGRQNSKTVPRFLPPDMHALNSPLLRVDKPRNRMAYHLCDYITLHGEEFLQILLRSLIS